MSTKYYPTMRSPGVQLYGPVAGAWIEDQAGHRTYGQLDYCFELSTSKTDGGEGQNLLNSEADTVTGAATDALFMVFATPRLAAMTVSGTLDLCLFVRADNPGTTAVYKIHAYVSVGNSRTVRHTLINNLVDSAAWSDVSTFRTLNAPAALTSAALLDGDRIIVEIGRRITANDGLDTEFRLAIGTTDVAGAALADATPGDLVFAAGFLTFSQTHTAYALPAAPPHDASADAIVIGAVPYKDDTGYDTTVSVDTDKAVWYTWVADRSGPMVVHGLGSNYNLDLAITRDTAGGTSVSVTTKGSLWVGRSAFIWTFTAISGVTYFFKVKNSTSITANFAARRSGGFLQQFVLTPVDETLVRGDVYVDCQHIVKVRDGEIVNFCGVFYGNTPTGNAIDYSGAAMEDETSHLMVTAERLAVVLFPFELVEFVDLATMGRVLGELNFINYRDGVAIGDGSPVNSHPSHVVFDRLYRPHVGHFGDAYDFIGALGSADSSKLVRLKLDTVNPEVLQAFTVTQDVQGSDYFDIDIDNEFAYYTSAGRHIYRLTLATGAISVWATIAQDNPSQPRPGLRGLRLLPPGDGSRGLLVCDGVNVKLVVNGVVTRTDTPTLGHTSYDLDKVEFSPDGTTYYVSDQLYPALRKFSTTTGVEQAYYPLRLPTGQLCGFAVYQGFRAGYGPPGSTPDFPNNTYNAGPFPDVSDICRNAPPALGCWGDDQIPPSIGCVDPTARVAQAGSWATPYNVNDQQIGLLNEDVLP